jgi:hypothetical protein
MGMAAIGVALWRYKMKYSPDHVNWFNRDRFILSNGMEFKLEGGQEVNAKRTQGMHVYFNTPSYTSQATSI